MTEVTQKNGQIKSISLGQAEWLQYPIRPLPTSPQLHMPVPGSGNSSAHIGSQGLCPSQLTPEGSGERCLSSMTKTV